MQKVVVDLWKTGMHRVEVGIKKREEYRAKTRKFTADMDIIGEIRVDKETVGYVAYRKGLWEKEDPLERRLVIRTFTKDISWIAGIEENIGKSIALTLAYDTPSPAFTIFHAKSRIVYTVEKIRAKILETDMLIFTFIDENKVLMPLLIRSKRFAIGSDWDIIDMVSGKKVAHVDGKVLDIGGEFTIKTNIKSQKLVNSLVLIAALMKFYDDIKRKLDAIAERLKKRKTYIKLSKTDASFFFNPRVRR